jgi:hypothetical protein
MTRDELIKELWKFQLEQGSIKSILSAVDSYTSARLREFEKSLKIKALEASSMAKKCEGFNILDDSRYWTGRLRAYEIILDEVQELITKKRM